MEQIRKYAIVTVVAIIVIMLAGYLAKDYIFSPNSEKQIDTFLKQVYYNQHEDLTNDARFDDISDTYFREKKKGKYELTYGNIRMEFYDKDITTDFKKRLKEVGYEFKKNKDGDLVILFKGQKIDKYIN